MPLYTMEFQPTKYFLDRLIAKSRGVVPSAHDHSRANRKAYIVA